MKNLVTFLLMLAFIAVGCQQPEPEIHTVDVGFFTPYALYPETLNGKIKQLTERNYLAVEKDGNVIKDERLNKESRDSLSWTRDFRLSYNEDGMMTKLEYLDENDKTTSMDEITLKDKNIISGNYTHLDTLRHIFRVSYDEDGRISNYEMFQLPQDSLSWFAKIFYDDNGNHKEWVMFNAQGDQTGKFVFSINPEGRRSGYKFFNKEDSLSFEQQFTYNEQGVLQKQVLINKKREKSISEYEYKYDDHGNWIRGEAKSSDGKRIITERDIVYYQE